MQTKYIALICGAAVIGLAGCSDAKQTLGLTKKAPDEFKVVKRAPLAMPPEYTLRPPRAGAPRPQEQSTTEEARQTVFGGGTQASKAHSSSAEDSFLKQIGSTQADPDIRAKIEDDLGDLEEEEQPIGTKLLGIGGSSEAKAELLDAAEEVERLKQEKASNENGEDNSDKK